MNEAFKLVFSGIRGLSLIFRQDGALSRRAGLGQSRRFSRGRARRRDGRRTAAERAGNLYAEIDTERTGIAKRALDITGYYAHPDIFQLHVNTQPQSPVKFEASMNNVERGPG